VNARNKSKGTLLGMLLVTMVATAACSKEQAETSTSASPASSATATTGPVADQTKVPEKLTYFSELDPSVAATMKSMAEIGVYRQLEKMTGTKVEFQNVPGGQGGDQFNLMMASGKLPDVVEWYWGTVAKGPDSYIKEKRILALNDLIDKHAPNLSRLLKSKPELRKLITTDEGNIYAFPFIRGDDYLLTYQGLIIRKDWLDKVNRSVPVTIQDWEDTLRAFKQTDLNGNGKADEIPFELNLNGIKSSSAFIGAFGIALGFYQENGKVNYGPVQPEFKSFVSLMNRWYAEGLIDPEFATTDGQLLDAKVSSNKLGALVGNTGGGIGKYMTSVKPQISAFQLVAAPYPVLKKGDAPALGQKDSPYPGLGAAITTSAAHPEEIVKWLDMGYSPEGSMLFNFGIEGESYTMVNGYPTYTDLIMKNAAGVPVSQMMSKYIRGNQVGPFVQDRRYMEQYAALPEQKESIELWMKPDNKKQMPIVTLTSDESSKYASIMGDVDTFLKEKLTKFIIGVEPMDKFDAFAQTLQTMGIQDAVKVQQAALDRYNARK